MVVDTVAPVAPTLEGAKLGKESKPEIRGTAEAGSKVTIYKGVLVAENILGQVSANKEGRYVFVPGVGFADGAHLIRATAMDEAENVSVASGALSMKVDTAPPGVPVLTVKSPTKESRPEISVTAEAGSVVKVFSGDKELGEATENEEGEFSFVPETAFADGFYVLKAVATDEAGNEGGSSVEARVEVDTLAPIVPLLYVPSLTKDSTPEIGGTAEAGSKVKVKIGSIELGPVVVSSSGGYLITPSTALADGTHLVIAKATDEAGNESESSEGQVMVVDTVAPEAPVVGGAKLQSENKPTFKGTSEPGSKVTLYRGMPLPGLTTFESVAIPSESGWGSIGSEVWYSQTEVVYDGIYSLRSGTREGNRCRSRFFSFQG
jgi:hypothetical protein